jgi:predicted esterase YcpF (UPF0227 family)
LRNFQQGQSLVKRLKHVEDVDDMLFVWLNNRQKMLISLKRNGDEVYQQSSANLKRQDLLMWDSVE